MGKMTLWVRQSFEAAHSLSGTFPPQHQCARIHGHRYVVIVGVSAPDDGQDVMVDYHDMHAGLSAVLALLDHRNLNDVMDVPTTCENLCRLIMAKLAPMRPSWIEVQEQEGTGCRLDAS